MNVKDKILNEMEKKSPEQQVSFLSSYVKPYHNSVVRNFVMDELSKLRQSMHNNLVNESNLETISPILLSEKERQNFSAIKKKKKQLNNITNLRDELKNGSENLIKYGEQVQQQLKKSKPNSFEYYFWKDTRNELMPMMYTGGHTGVEIGEVFNITRARVQEILSKNGIDRTQGGKYIRMKKRVEEEVKKAKEELVGVVDGSLSKSAVDVWRDLLPKVKSEIANDFKKSNPFITRAALFKRSLNSLGCDMQSLMKVSEEMIVAGQSPEAIILKYRAFRTSIKYVRKIDFDISFMQYWEITKDLHSQKFFVCRKDLNQAYTLNNVFISPSPNPYLSGYSDDKKQQVITSKEKSIVLAAKKQKSTYDHQKKEIITLLTQGKSVNQISEQLQIPETSLRDLLKKSNLGKVVETFSGQNMGEEERREMFYRRGSELKVLR